MKRLWCFALFFLVLPTAVSGEVVKGIYGVPSIGERDPLSYVEDMEEAGVNAVFVKPDLETVKWFKERGLKVFVCVDAYGGKKAWKRFPDSRQVLAEGSLLGKDRKYGCHGGACASHEGWRKARLADIDELIRGYEARGVPIDGIWLDYIRYPGRWSVVEPKIPDTCYCKRCLETFAKDTGIQAPTEGITEQAADWIKKNCPYEWMKWKKGRIERFVRAVRRLVDQHAEKTRPILGIFLVPWTHGERGNAVCYAFGQDGFELAQYADVISPMVYHKKVGRPVSWVGYMTRYYAERAGCEVWPIVEAVVLEEEKVGRSEGEKVTGLGEVMRYAGEGGAGGVLAFAFGAVDKGKLWEGFEGFERLPDMLRKAQSAKSGAQSAKSKMDAGDAWMPGWLDGEDLVSVCPEYGECEEWVAPLGDCEPGQEYEFRGEFYQRVWENGKYPKVSLWGKRCLLNTHWKSKVFQPLRAYVRCPDEMMDPTFRFINCNSGKEIRLRNPEVRRFYEFEPRPALPVKKWFYNEGFFPIGVYGADLNSLEEIKKLAINTVILGGRGEALRAKVEKCHAVGLRYVLSVPRDPDRLKVYLDDIAQYVRPYDLAFYVNDEPGIHSFPTGKAEEVNRLIKERFPRCATCMAIVRPQVCRNYRHGADFLMLDQYPVPFMPMTWLSDSMAQCAKSIAQSEEPGGQGVKGEKGLAQRPKHAKKEAQSSPVPNTPAKRLASVIQAFGGPRRLDHPRLPTWREMNCLAFLSVVHGARAVFFYRYSWIGKTEEGRERLGRVVGRLNRVYPWLVVENTEDEVDVEMISENRFDPKGRPAVQCSVKRKGDEGLVIAVNTIGTSVEVSVSAPQLNTPKGTPVQRGREGMSHGADFNAREVFSGEKYVLKDGKMRVRLGPYGVKAFLSADCAD
ncbi:MAG: hypothetical protein ACLFUL_10900 [Desulfobacteraceae bacterium]